MNRQLPPGWVETSLAKVCHIRSGNSTLIKGRMFSEPTPDLVPAFSASGQDIWCEHAEHHGPGIVVSAVGARCGKAFLADGSWTAIANTQVARPMSGINVKFLWYLLNDEDFWVKGGSAQPFVKVKSSLEIVILLPPIAEQERIVDAIEEQFSRIDAVESAAQAALIKLDTLRRTVLTAAFSGRLVEPFNPRRSPDGLPEDWQCLSVGDVSDVQLGRQRSPNNHYGPHMRPYLRAANITWSGIDLNDVKEMNFDPSEANNFELCVGDILLNEASGSPNEVGKPAIWWGEIEPCYFQNTLLRVRTRGPLIHYLYWHFHFLARLGKFGEAGRGVNIRHLGKQGLVNFPIIIAPLHEQKRIVAAIEEHFSRIDATKASLERCLQRCGVLRRSVLTAAFSGRLVEQDPNDEPASVLLERIAAEQPKSAAPRRRSA